MLGTAAGQYHAPKAFKTPKDAAPPDREGLHLDFRSGDIENTNDARGDHGCGLSGAQATVGPNKKKKLHVPRKQPE